MNPEPPIGWAMPQASAADPSGTICSHAPSLFEARPATRIAAAPAAPASTREGAVADLLGDEPHGRRVADRVGLGGREREHDQEEGNTDAVVEPTLHVQASAAPATAAAGA